MNKAELIAAVAEKTGMSKKDTETVIVAALNTITEALAEEEKVQLVGFGSFELKKRAARLGRNPKTKEAIEIPASKVPVFKAGKALKDKVAKGLEGGNASDTFVAAATATAAGNSNAADAVGALVMLGYSQSEAAIAVGKLDQTLSTEELIKQALKQLA